MNLQVIKNRIAKALAYIITAILFVIISFFLVLQMPPVQNYIIGKYLVSFSQKTGFRTTIKGFQMLWFDRLELEDVAVYDPANNKMITAKSILINFKISQLLQKRNVNIDGVYLDSAHVYLTKMDYADTARDLNLNVFIANIKNAYGRKGSGGNPPKINIGEAFVNQSQFTYVNQDRDTIRKGFDYNHFSLSVDEAQLNSFVILGDTTEFDLQTLIAQDLKTKFTVNQLSTFFRLCQKSMEFRNLDLHAGNSLVSDNILFTYENLLDLNELVEKVKIHATLSNSTIDPNDLAFFAPGIERVGQRVKVDGVFDGFVNDFKFTRMKIVLGNTYLAGSLDMDGLPNVNETFMVINLRNSLVDPNDLAFLFNENTIKRLLPMGILSMDGQFLGYPTDFVANGNFSGDLGTIKSDLNLKVNEDDIDKSVYSGNLALVDFNLGVYLNDTLTFQKVNMEGKVAGSGLSQNSADFRLDGQVHSLGLKGYNYKNIITNARFASERFDGLLEIDDPNLQAKVNGTIDLREARNIVNVNASLDTAFLHNLNLSKDSIFLRADFVADTKGLTLDSLSGTADFHNFKIIFNGESLALDSIRLNAYRDKDYRSIRLQTSLADAEIKGVFYLSDLYDNIRTLSKEIGLNLRNNEPEIEDYYQKKTYKPKSHQADINITLKDVKPFVSLLNIDLDLSPNTTIKGKFTSGYTTIFQAYTGFDSLRYKGNLFLDSEVDFTASKIADSTSVLAMASIVSDRQLIGPKLKTKNLLVEGIWNNNLIEFGLDADQDGQSNYIRLKGNVEFLHDSTMITMAPSSLQLLERNWSFMPDNYFSVKGGSNWNFHHLALTNAEQSVGVNGELSEDPSKILSVDIHNLDLSLLNVITTKKFTGILDANVEMSDFYNAPSLQNDVNIKDLTVNEFLVGDVTGRNQWDTLQNKFSLNLYIDRIQQRIVNLVGVYDPSDKKSPLNIVANLENANIKILEPFLEDIFSNMGGTVSGQFNIAGSLDAPRIRGEGTLSAAKIMINYLRTSYLVSGKVGLTPTSIYFKDIELTDSFKNEGTLNGAITHEAFSRMTINIDASFRNFQVLNTSAKDNNLFYGQAYATGTVNLAGPISNLRITSEARTERNTRVYIPVSGTSTTDQKEFINFVNFTDTTYVKKYAKNISNKINLTGITFDLNLDVTPDAYCEIIIDIKAGDIIRGRGNGDLKLQIDTKGEFNMFGPFEFTEGWYNFTLYDIINKEFEINKGSTITWLGDPYQGVLNIDASYNQLASLLPIIPDVEVQESPPSQLRRKYPVQVLLQLEGPMLSPLFTFDIDAKDLPKNISSGTRPINLDLEFTAFKNKLDEQELKRQVFSLIVLRRFSPPESFNTSGTVVSSLSELLSNQLSYWMSQVDENLEIDVDIASMDQESFNTFQLRFSYTFMNGRLRVTGDGTFNNTSNQPTGANPNSVAGDWTLDYKLTADGKLRVKMYSRTNVNPILYSVQNQTAMTTGASIIHTQSFNELRDLFTSSRKQNKNDEESKDSNKEALKEEDGGE